MLFNKNKFRKTNEKKLLHKVGKQWVTVSIAMLALLGGSLAVSAVTHASHVDDAPAASKPEQVRMSLNHMMRLGASSKQNNNSGQNGVANQSRSNAITKQAHQLHTNILNNNVRAQNAGSTGNQEKTRDNDSQSNNKIASDYNQTNPGQNQSDDQSPYDRKQNNSYQVTESSALANDRPTNLKQNAPDINVHDAQDEHHYNVITNTVSLVYSDNNGNKVDKSVQVKGIAGSKVNIASDIRNNMPKGCTENGTNITINGENNNSDTVTMKEPTPSNSAEYEPTDPMTGWTAQPANTSDEAPAGSGYHIYYNSSTQTATLTGDFSQYAKTGGQSLIDTGAVGFANEIDLGNAKFGNNANLNNMFSGIPTSTIKLVGNWDTSNVTNMSDMFAGMNSIKTFINFSDLDTRNVTIMEGMFSGDSELKNVRFLSNWNIKNTTDMQSMFLNSTYLINRTIAPGWNIDSDGTPKGINQAGKQENVPQVQTVVVPIQQSQKNIKIHFHDIYGDIDGLTPPSDIQEKGSPGQKYTVNNPSNWAIVNPDGTIASGTNNVSNDSIQRDYGQGDQTLDIAPVYQGLTYKYNKSNKSVEFTNGTMNWNGDGEYIHAFIGRNDEAPSNINDAKAITFDNNVNTKKVTSIRGMFDGDNNLQSLTLPNSFDTSNVSDMGRMFNEDSNLQSLTLPSSFDTLNVSDMDGMFSGVGLKSLVLPNSFNTSKVTNMDDMFESDSSLQSLTLPNSFNTANVTNMGNMFMDDKALQSLALPNSFNTANVTNMSDMFYDTGAQTLTLPSSFNTSKVTDMNDMFNDDSNLQSLTLPSSFNTSKITDMDNMFGSDSSLQSLTLPNSFNTGNVTNMSFMFNDDFNLQSLTLPNSFDTSNVTNMTDMLSFDSALRSLTLPSSFNTSKVTNMGYMFSSDKSLWLLTIQSPSTKFRGDSSIPQMYQKDSFDNYTSRTPVNLADTQSHVGTFVIPANPKPIPINHIMLRLRYNISDNQGHTTTIDSDVMPVFFTPQPSGSTYKVNPQDYNNHLYFRPEVNSMQSIRLTDYKPSAQNPDLTINYIANQAGAMTITYTDANNGNRVVGQQTYTYGDNGPNDIKKLCPYLTATGPDAFHWLSYENVELAPKDYVQNGKLDSDVSSRDNMNGNQILYILQPPADYHLAHKANPVRLMPGEINQTVSKANPYTGLMMHISFSPMPKHQANRPATNTASSGSAHPAKSASDNYPSGHMPIIGPSDSVDSVSDNDISSLAASELAPDMVSQPSSAKRSIVSSAHASVKPRRARSHNHAAKRYSHIKRIPVRYAYTRHTGRIVKAYAIRRHGKASYRLVICRHHHNYYVRGMSRYIQPYELRTKRHKRNYIKLTRSARVYTTRYRHHRRSYIVRKGSILRVRKVVRINKYMTCFKLKGGRYITSNRDFVKVIKRHK